MTNYVQPGDVVTLTAPYNRTSGQGALVGKIFGVATVTVSSTVEAEFQLTGVFDLEKAAAIAFTQGQTVYWDDAAKNCVAAGDPEIGVAILEALAAAPTVRVRLHGNTNPPPPVGP